jgi:hypothetical protein
MANHSGRRGRTKVNQFGVIKSDESNFKDVEALNSRNNMAVNEEGRFKLFTEFVNVYSDKNMFAKDGDIVYFLLMNNIHYYIPLIFKGEVLRGIFGEGMSVAYIIKPIEFIDTALTRFVEGMPFTILGITPDGYISNVKDIQIRKVEYLLGDLAVKQHCFFVRHNIEEIMELRREYSEWLRSDLENELKTSEEFLNLIK